MSEYNSNTQSNVIYYPKTESAIVQNSNGANPEDRTPPQIKQPGKITGYVEINEPPMSPRYSNPEYAEAPSSTDETLPQGFSRDEYGNLNYTPKLPFSDSFMNYATGCSGGVSYAFNSQFQIASIHCDPINRFVKIPEIQKELKKSAEGSFISTIQQYEKDREKSR
jgi:hypothetical protein